MKIAICGDVHFCKNSSMIHSIGDEFSTRLENCIKSVVWFETLAVENRCDFEIYLGDFFDKSTLCDEEITALQKIEWNKLHKYFITGNHESSVDGLRFNSTNALIGDNRTVVSEPTVFKRWKRYIGIPGTEDKDSDNVLKIGLLPYQIENDRKSIKEYFDEDVEFIFSHNDIKGIQYGGFLSKIGFDLDDIKNSCKLYINGHLHNGDYVDSDKRVLNLGNLTGQNFTEDAFRYSHRVAILDTDTLEIKFFENPYAFNFYKIVINSNEDIKQLDKLKNNAVVSINCDEKFYDETRERLKQLNNIVESRVIMTYDRTTLDDSKLETQKQTIASSDYLQRFNNFCLENIENKSIVQEELNEICS